jgi:hypothetical protein
VEASSDASSARTQARLEDFEQRAGGFKGFVTEWVGTAAPTRPITAEEL